MKKHISKSLVAAFLSLFGLSSNVAGMDSGLIKNPNNVDLTKIGISKKSNNHGNDDNLIVNPNNVDLTKIGAHNNNFLEFNDNKNFIATGPSESENKNKGDSCNKKTDFKFKNIPDKPYVSGEAAIKVSYPFNILVIADTKDRMQKVTSLLRNNNVNISLGKLKSIGDFNNYESGGIYQAVNNQNINILCITLDDFINNSFDYDLDFICQNTSKIFYVFKSNSSSDKLCYDKLQKFYHKFNKHWCGKDLNYCNNYDPSGVTIWEPRFQGPVLARGRNDWFEYIRVKRGLDDHRYIYFLLDNNMRDCYEEFLYFVAQMPDGRSVTTCELNAELNAKFLNDLIFGGFYGTPQGVTLFSDYNKNSNDRNLKSKIITGSLVTAALLGTTGVAYKFYKKFKSKNQTSNKNQQLEIKDKSIKQIDTKSVS